MKLKQAKSEQEVLQGRELFEEYAAWLFYGKGMWEKKSQAGNRPGTLLKTFSSIRLLPGDHYLDFVGSLVQVPVSFALMNIPDGPLLSFFTLTIRACPPEPTPTEKGDKVFLGVLKHQPPVHWDIAAPDVLSRKIETSSSPP